MTNETQFVVYSKDNCPWCDRAIALLKERGCPYQELKYGVDYEKADLVNKLTAIGEFDPYVPVKLTTPQIFLGTELVGGFDELDTMFDIVDKINTMTKKDKQ